MQWNFWRKRKPEPEPESRILTDRELAKLVGEFKNIIVDTYRQETLSGLDDVCNDIMKEFKATAGRRCWKLSQQWCQWDNEPILQPNQSRLFYRKGNTDIMVIEQDPAIRTLSFNESFGSNQGSYNLAMPYVVFVFRFLKGCFHDVYAMFNDKPLGDLSEKPLRPYLTNIGDDLRVCLGKTFTLPSDDLSYHQAVQYVLNYYWNASHSNEWNSHFHSNMQHFEGCDGRLATLKAWSDASIKNQLFVIDDVNWQTYNRSIGDLIVGLTKGDNKVREFEDVLFADLIQDFVRQVSSGLKSALEIGAGKVEQQPLENTERKLLKLMQKFKISE